MLIPLNVMARTQSLFTIPKLLIFERGSRGISVARLAFVFCRYYFIKIVFLMSIATDRAETLHYRRNVAFAELFIHTFGC